MRVKIFYFFLIVTQLLTYTLLWLIAGMAFTYTKLSVESDLLIAAVHILFFVLSLWLTISIFSKRLTDQELEKMPSTLFVIGFAFGVLFVILSSLNYDNDLSDKKALSMITAYPTLYFLISKYFILRKSTSLNARLDK